MRATPLGEQRVACRAGGLLDSAYRFVFRPGENFMADRSRRKPAIEPVDLGAAFGPQPMIHRHRANAPTAFACPAISQNGKGKAIGPTRNGNGEKRAILEAGERGEGRRELGLGKRPWWRCLGQHPSFFFSSFARSLIAFPGFGKSRSSCASVMQAFCFWFARASDMPSFKRSSGALGPF